jgi:hypothetical protein
MPYFATQPISKKELLELYPPAGKCQMLNKPYEKLNPADHAELMYQIREARAEYFKLMGWTK